MQPRSHMHIYTFAYCSSMAFWMGMSRLYLLGISMFVKLVWIGLFWYHCFELQPYWITKKALYLWWGKLACLFELCWLYLAESAFLSQGFSLHISVGGVKASADSPDLQSWFFFFTAQCFRNGPCHHAGRILSFTCPLPFPLHKPESQAYPTAILEGALYQSSASQASDYRIIKNLDITHVVNTTADSPNAILITMLLEPGGGTATDIQLH